MSDKKLYRESGHNLPDHQRQSSQDAVLQEVRPRKKAKYPMSAPWHNCKLNTTPRQIALQVLRTKHFHRPDVINTALRVLEGDLA